MIRLSLNFPSSKSRVNIYNNYFWLSLYINYYHNNNNYDWLSLYYIIIYILIIIDDKEIVIRYKKALSIEEPNFIKEIRSTEESDIHGHALIQEVLNSWEKRVTKVAKSVIAEKTVVCGRSTKWWDEEIKGKIKQRREVYIQEILT